MADYIDREALLKDIEESVVFSVRSGHISPEMRGANKITDRIKSAPTADVEEVKYGYWKREENDVFFWYVCSECREEIPKTRYANDLFSSYCPYCGAKMDGGNAE